MNELAQDPNAKRLLYGRYQDHGDKLAVLDLQNRQWQSQLHKQASHKALDEPMLDDDMGDIYAPKTITQTGISPKAMIGIIAMLLPLAGVGGIGAAVMLNQWMNASPVVAPTTPASVSNPGTDTIAIPKLDWGPERP